MKITVFGANGGIGKLFTEQALKEGHELHLYARAKGDLQESDNCRIFIGDLTDYHQMREAIADADAVVSFLGPKIKFSYPGMPISTGHANIIRIMEELNISRIITIATPAVRFEKDQTSIATVLPRIMASLFLPKPYKEIVAVGDMVKVSGLQWTVVRFIAPVDGPPTGKVNVTFGEQKISFKITRADIAGFVLKELSNRNFIRSMPIIGS